jgi:uncharacterized iron-regulated membrane protein
MMTGDVAPAGAGDVQRDPFSSASTVSTQHCHLIGSDISVPALPAGTTAVSLDRVVEAAQQRYPKEFVQFFVWDRDRPGLIRLTMAPVPSANREQFHRLIIDARTAQILGEPVFEKKFTRFLLELHGELLLGLPGELFLGPWPSC